MEPKRDYHGRFSTTQYVGPGYKKEEDAKSPFEKGFSDALGGDGPAYVLISLIEGGYAVRGNDGQTIELEPERKAIVDAKVKFVIDALAGERPEQSGQNEPK